jgi:Flp pilus assembly protein TadG
MLSLSPRHKALRPARDAVAALEFGIIAPVMALLVIGVFDISKAAILWEQVWSASRSISESASTLAIQADGSAQLTGAQVDQALSAVIAEIPWLRAGIATAGETASNAGQTASAVLTSVDYEIPAGCASNCDYQAVVKWSKAYHYPGFKIGSAVLRPCASKNGPALDQNLPGSPPSLQAVPTANVETLPKSGIAVPDAFLMADVKLTYTPFFFNFVTGNVTFTATTYWAVRSSVPAATDTWASLDPAAPNDPTNPHDSPAQQCP